MIAPSKALIKIIDKLKSNNVKACINKSNIKIDIDLTKTNFSKISPLLYAIVNKFEKVYLVFIEGVPFCLMPDAAHHLIYTKKNEVVYERDNICKECKYCKLCPGWMVENVAQNIRTKGINDLPREIVFEVTNKCNLNCPLCFSQKGSRELPLGRIKALIDECVELGIKIVRFTGGEPLLYKDINEALDYARSKKLHIILNTNATVVSNETERILKCCVDDMLISFQGFNSASEKILTQCSVDFKEKIHNIARFNSQIALVRLGTIISRTLINNFSKYFYLIKSLGIKNWELYRPMACSQSEEFNITCKDILKLMKQIKLKKLQGNDIMIANPIPFCITKDINLSHHVLTGAEFDDGHSRLVVDTRGFLKPSYSIPENLGNSIKDAWEKPFLKKIHSLDYLPRNCQNCFSLRWCKGGSRLWAKITHGNYFDIDPLMDQEREKQI